jgi:UPF0716 protein FxsA
VRRRIPWWVLALLFVGLPMVEIYLLVQLGQQIGAWWTLLIVIGAGVLGTYLVKREGGRAWKALQVALASHRMPATELADGALILIGGTLLLTPGFVSDVFGLFCILPFTRPMARRVLAKVIARRLTLTAASPFGASASFGQPFGQSSGQSFGDSSGRPGPSRNAPHPGHEDVIRGEVVDDD